MGLQTDRLHVIVNDTPLLEYDRSQPVPGQQKDYLDNMDVRMTQGIELNGQHIPEPDSMQRCQFVANSMMNALFEKNHSLAIAMCTWLGERIPELKKVQASGNIKTDMRVDLIFDQGYLTNKTEQNMKSQKQKNSSKSKS